MKTNKGITIISLIITIILIIIIATITSTHLSTTLDDAEYKSAKENLKNVENVVEYAKTQILIDEFMPNEQLFKITEVELEDKFGKVLTQEEKNYINQVNNSDDIKAPYKYYLMNQKRFDEEFGNDYNISNLKPDDEYLVNYMETFVLSDFEDVKIANSEVVIPSQGDERGRIDIVYTPNGNIEWKKQQSTMIMVNSNSAVEIEEIKYLWSQSYTEPKAEDFSDSLTSGQNIKLESKTGNDWYVWVYVEYIEDGIKKTYITRSEPFYIDNTRPSANLEVEELNM